MCNVSVSVCPDPRKKYHVKLLAFNVVGDGYQADQTISTPGCVCESPPQTPLRLGSIILMLCSVNPISLSFSAVRDRLVPPPPPPHNVNAQTNSSSSIFLQWGRPAFTASHTLNYTVRCNPVGLQNASLVLYLQT